MADVNLPFESLLSATGLTELKAKLDALLSNPAATGEIVFNFLLDQTDLPQHLPVNISKVGSQYVIQAKTDLVSIPQEFNIAGLQSALYQFAIKLNDTATQIDELIFQAESHLNSIRNKIGNELSKLPFSIQIRPTDGGGNEFFINQTLPIEGKIQGMDINIVSSSLTFDSNTISQLELSAEIFLPEIKAENGIDPHQIDLLISLRDGIFSGSATNFPPAKLQGINVIIKELTLIVENDEFQSGTEVNGDLVFDFLDDGTSGPGKIGFNVELQNNGDVRIFAQNPENQELTKGSISLFFEQIQIIFHSDSSSDVSIAGWAQLPGVIDSSTQLPARTDFNISYDNPYFEFTGSDFSPIPLGFGSIAFDTVFLKIHDNGNVEESTLDGKMSLPIFSNGELDFSIAFESSATKKFAVKASSPTEQPLGYGGIILDLTQFEMHYENGALDDLIGNGALTFPVITNGTPILISFVFSETAQNENVVIQANDFGTPELAGCQVDFSQILFQFTNGVFTNSLINGRLKLPDSTDGAGLAFNLILGNQGNDFSIQLDGNQSDNQLNFGSIQLALNAFEVKVVANQLQSITGEGSMQLPGLSEAFDFDLDVQIEVSTTIYSIQVNNVLAEISGFNLTFTQINLSSQSSQQFSASAIGSLTLPVFEEGGGLDFSINFDRDENYHIAVNSGGDFVKFGDFELNQVQLLLDVKNGVLKDFTGNANLMIPAFPTASLVSVVYSKVLNQYLISLTNPLAVEVFGGELTLDSLLIEIRNRDFQNGNAIGVYKLPDTTGGAGIQFEMTIGDNGKNYSLNLTGAPEENTIEFGPVALKFESFNLVVDNSRLQSVAGAGALQLPGLSHPFNFTINVNTSGTDPIYIIEITDVTADLASFNLHFDQIRIESRSSQNFLADVNGNLLLPAFDGTPLNFDLSIGRDQSYAIAVDGLGQNANFGIFILSDVNFSIAVSNGVVGNSTGNAKFHIPELTEPSSPFEVGIIYSKNGTEDFALAASNLPEVDLSIFTLDITALAFLIRNGGFESGSLEGTVTMPFFTNGGSLTFSFLVQNEGNSYKVSIGSVGVLEGNGLEIKDLLLQLDVNNGGLLSVSGTSKFKLPAADDFIGVSIAYNNADNKLSFSASPLPDFSRGGLTFNFSQFGFAIQNENLKDAIFAGKLIIPACDTGNNELNFNFELTNGNDYTIQANPGPIETELKLGDVSLFISEFDLRILNGELESIDTQAGLEFSGLENENGSAPARIDIGFGYTKATQIYKVSVSQNQKISIGGFAFTIKVLELSFTPTSLSYPFTFSGDLEIPGLEQSGGEQAVIEVDFTVPSKGNFTGSLKSNAELTLGSIKITISEIEVSKVASDVTIKLKGQLELEEFSGMGGDPAVIAIDIEIDNQGAFKVLGEIEAPDAVKVIDLPNIIRIYLNKIGLSRTASNDWDFELGGLIENLIVIPGMDDLLPNQLNLKELKFGNDFNIDLDVRWPSGLSISFGGSASEAIIPVNGKFGNAVSLDAIKVSYKDNGALGVDLGLAFSGASITLGPVAASVEGLGIVASLTRPIFSNGVPQSNANFGVVNIDIQFKPPTGLGVSLDTPVFTGGGYLFFDKEKGEYAGAVELSVLNIFAVSAIGIINSKMPDGKPGTSVLFIISVEFGTGIALGFGFFLSGLGGILGIHRTIQVERLRDGVRSGTIQNILFPKDIIANINKILTDIKEVFPVKRDQFVLGPMAAITWGVPTILRVDLGVVIEFANPVRFGILGVLRVILPDENAALIKIQVAFLGLIDFEKGMLSFDASLFDSKVLTFGLEGDMVLRISWGEKPDFVLSVGGFHPRFRPPTHLQIPVMKRLTLKILSGNPRLTLTCYFAVTSNTVQFGAGIDFYFKVSKFKVVGEFGFDVLFQFSPFHFIADARARLAVKAGNTTILSLSLVFSLEGPTPWRAKGTAKFKILFFSVKVKFDVTWGDRRDTTLPNIEVFPLLMDSLEDIQNWRSVVARSGPSGIRMKGISTQEGLILTPNGSIEINQKIVPLEVEISKFGQFKPADFTKFEITEISIGASQADFDYIQDSFAPSNFLELADNEKLTLPSFNNENAGVKLSGTDSMKTGSVTDREVKYEQLVMDEANHTVRINKLADLASFNKQEINFFSSRGAVSRSPLSSKNFNIYNAEKVELKQPGYTVVNTDNLVKVQNVGTKLSYMDAVNSLNVLKASGNSSIQLVASDVLSL